MRPPPLTRYRQLINDLKETTYKGYWNKKLGASPDSTPSFPEDMKVDEITFGDPYKYGIYENVDKKKIDAVKA